MKWKNKKKNWTIFFRVSIFILLLLLLFLLHHHLSKQKRKNGWTWHFTIIMRYANRMTLWRDAAISCFGGNFANFQHYICCYRSNYFELTSFIRSFVRSFWIFPQSILHLLPILIIDWQSWINHSVEQWKIREDAIYVTCFCNTCTRTCTCRRRHRCNHHHNIQYFEAMCLYLWESILMREKKMEKVCIVVLFFFALSIFNHYCWLAGGYW